MAIGGYSRRTSPTSRRQRPSALSAGGRLGLGLLVVSLVLASTEASLFKRRRNKGVQQPGAGGKGGKGKGGKRGKVKEDVAWLLEDTSDGTWKPVRDDGHVQVWKRSMPNSDFVAIKSKASLAVSPQALFEVLTPGDIEIVRQYNPLVEDGSDLEVIDRDNKISWSATMGVWPCRPRDFVTHIRRATLDDGSVAIVNSATTHPKAPVKGKYVRGEILHGVFHIKAAKNKKHSEFTMVHHFNPGGNIPPWLINWLAEGKPAAFVRKLEEVAEKWDKQAAQTKSMPCKGRGFGDKPCAFLLSPTDTSQEADGLASGVPLADRGWPAFLATLTMAAVLCGGWVACFGWPAPSEKIELSPAAITEDEGAKETNGSLPGADANATRAVPATHETHAPPPCEWPSGERREMPEEEAVISERAAERGVGEGLSGEAQDAERPDVEVPNGEVPNGGVPGGEGSNAEKEPGGEPSGGPSGEMPNGEVAPKLVDGEHVSGRGEGMSSSAPAASAASAATATTIAPAAAATAADGEIPEESGTLPSPLPSPQEKAETVVLDGDGISKDSPERQAACVKRNGGGVEDFGDTGPPDPDDAHGSPDPGEMGATARNEGGEVSTAAHVVNGDVCGRSGCSGETASLEISSGKAASREFRENSLFLFGDKPFENSTG